MKAAKPPLSNLQVELLKLFNTNIPNEQLIEIRKMIGKYLLQNARNKATKIWDKKKMNDKMFK